jgi:hypothetical protein
LNRLYIAAAVVSVFASPGFAQSPQNAWTQRPAQAQDRPAYQDAYGGKRRFGFDPDPDVQFDLLRQRNWRKG